MALDETPRIWKSVREPLQDQRVADAKDLAFFG